VGSAEGHALCRGYALSPDPFSRLGCAGANVRIFAHLRSTASLPRFLPCVETELASVSGLGSLVALGVQRATPSAGGTGVSPKTIELRAIHARMAERESLELSLPLLLSQRYWGVPRNPLILLLRARSLSPTHFLASGMQEATIGIKAGHAIQRELASPPPACRDGALPPSRAGVGCLKLT
jgi:hypothetical protein